MSHLGVAAPLVDDGSLNTLSQDVTLDGLHSLAPRSPNNAYDVMVHLEGRAFTCTHLNGQLIRVIKSTTAQLGFLNIGLVLAADICEHYHFDDCKWWIREIQWGINAIFSIAAAHGAVNGADGVSPDQELQLLHDDRFNYDLVEEVDILAITYQKRSNDEPHLMHRSIVRGIKNEGFTHDVAFNHYTNGGTVLHLGGPNETLAADPSRLSKRAGFGHEGFKISFTTRQGSALTKDEQDQMANDIARDWSERVFQATEYIGLVKDGHKADFYYRIIPELQGFGLNYESVDVCGGMASLL
ncbi:hypothetical protein BDV23DRAFT_186659 [Aspergillus alliaceus]|uniref:Uncharacterized protein n=1 Tax=Petromyces alliaceus TaxID=209559 RepID=A0A5N7BZ25_PETAA|nr:hypothetical protein BDV23DRAFT_186659 [Aspergillus alliaceus]